MIIKTYESPFFHFTVENFFSQEDFNIINGFSEWEVPPPIEGRNNFQDRFIPTFIRDIILPYAHRLEAQIREPKQHSWINLEFDTIVPGFEYPVHPDDPNKDFVFVVHLSDTGKGTCLHDVNGDLVKTIPWLPNGGGGFIRSDVSFHSFNTHGLTEPRRTLIINLAK